MSSTLSEKKSIEKANVLDLVRFIRLIKKKRLRVIVVLITCVVIGLVLHFFKESTYTARSEFIGNIKESNQGLPSGLGGLAGIAGVDIDMGGRNSLIPPELYPRIIASVDFKRHLMHSKLTYDSESVSYAEYYEKLYKPSILSKLKGWTIGLPVKIINALRKKDELAETAPDSGDENRFITLDANELAHFSRLSHQLSIRIDDRDDVIELTFKMDNPVMAAQLAHVAVQYLQEKIINFNISHTKMNLEYIEESYEQQKDKFQLIQQRLAKYEDSNLNLSSSLANTRFNILRAEYEIAQGVYSELSKQLEQTKLKLKQDTPVFTTLQPIVVPFNKDGPKGTFVLIISAIIGVFLAVLMIVTEEYILLVGDKVKDQSML